LGRLAGLESLMGGAEHVAANRFTVADISIGYALMLLKITGLFDQAPASLQAYYGRLRERPAFKRAKAAQKAAASEKGVPPPLPSEKVSTS
jgi:glutathione S-transferase